MCVCVCVCVMQIYSFQLPPAEVSLILRIFNPSYILVVYHLFSNLKGSFHFTENFLVVAGRRSEYILIIISSF